MSSDVTCHPMSRLFVGVLIILLCMCVPQYGVALALLLVLSSVPCLQPALALTEQTNLESFANPSSNPSSDIKEGMVASSSIANTKAHEIAQKMDIFTKINRKRDLFKQQIAGIENDLAGIKEFYVNASRGKPGRKKKIR